MSVDTLAGYTNGLVNLDSGLISRDIFTRQSIYDEELERIFARSWLFVGHESQIPEPGDYILGKMAEESVIFNRDRHGKLHVFLNNCRHRGMRVCRYDRGNSTKFACPFHAWVFSDEGKLVGVPKLDSAYHNELDRSKWGLIEARVYSYYGYVFACWDEETPDFETYLGDLRFYFDDYCELPDGTHGEWEAFGGTFKWRVPCNWKFGAENFAGDYYHNPSHASVDSIVLSPAGGDWSSGVGSSDLAAYLRYDHPQARAVSAQYLRDTGRAYIARPALQGRLRIHADLSGNDGC